MRELSYYTPANDTPSGYVWATGAKPGSAGHRVRYRFRNDGHCRVPSVSPLDEITCFTSRRSLPIPTGVDESDPSTFAIKKSSHMAPCSKSSSRRTPATLSDVGMVPTSTSRTHWPCMVLATIHRHMDRMGFTVSPTFDYGRSRFTVCKHYLALDVPGRPSSNSPFRTASTRRCLKTNGALKHKISL